jgi:hypothetical protein
MMLNYFFGLCEYLAENRRVTYSLTPRSERYIYPTTEIGNILGSLVGVHR